MARPRTLRAPAKSKAAPHVARAPRALAPEDRDELDARLAREAWEEMRRDPSSVVSAEAYAREVYARYPRAVPAEVRRAYGIGRASKGRR